MVHYALRANPQFLYGELASVWSLESPGLFTTACKTDALWSKQSEGCISGEAWEVEALRRWGRFAFLLAKRPQRRRAKEKRMLSQASHDNIKVG